MSRTATETQVTEHVIGDEQTPGLTTMADAWNELAVIEQEASENAIAVARQVGYDGSLTVGALEDEIRFYQRRSVEACIELGKRLLVLKELTPHGEFAQRAELLGLAPRMAQKFMAATLKFANANSNSLLKASGTQSKLLELLVLDDGEISALESGETVRGIDLDKIETMSVSELKKALREAEADKQAKDQVIKNKTAELIKKDEQLVRRAHVDWPEAFEGYYNQLAQARKQIKVELGKLELIRKSALAIEPTSEAEEAVLNQARETLAKELIGIHNEVADMVEALAEHFDKTLGLYADDRLDLIKRATGIMADDE